MKNDQTEMYADRIRRSSREIAIAAVLTVAAFVFVVAALFGGSVTTDRKVGVIASEGQVIQ
jgi:hypothetical protein